ncbi:hypothetical protein [Nocardiopsis sp. YSL2]|uniref:hypothetical protein n=1 Tax=Nocardiopsis sp. YSL2 TaxID=2939492 RepID=UPI0026F42AF9|nr:hypothetical protein [Nocardiopsis sp. YSL2]
MTLPTYDDAFARARDQVPFSNGTEGLDWEARWCATCVHDVDGQAMTGPGCPLLMVALSRRTPAEWTEGPRDESGHYSIRDQYRCGNYEQTPGGGA